MNAAPDNAIAAVANYKAGIEAGGRVSVKSVQEETWRRRLSSFAEFQSFFDPTMAAFGKEKAAVEATPSDLVAYHEPHWVNNHGETVLEGEIGPYLTLS